MADVEEGTAGKEFGIEAGPVKINTKGYHLGNFLQIMAVCMLAILAYMMYELKTETKVSAAAITSVATISAGDKLDHDKMNRSLEKVVEAQDAATYVLTLKQEERERLNLRMPESLRRRHER